MNFKRVHSQSQELVSEHEHNYDAEMKDLSIMGSLTEDEIDFLKFKRMRNASRFHAPDPRQGDYET